MDAINILNGVEGIHFCHFEASDVVRHALVQRIVNAYESAKPQQQELALGMGEGITEQPQGQPAHPAMPQ